MSTVAGTSSIRWSIAETLSSRKAPSSPRRQLSNQGLEASAVTLPVVHAHLLREIVEDAAHGLTEFGFVARFPGRFGYLLGDARCAVPNQLVSLVLVQSILPSSLGMEGLRTDLPCSRRPLTS